MSEIDKRTATMTNRRGTVLSVPDIRIMVAPESGQVTEIPLTLEAVMIGTGSDCDIVLTDRHVSRHHCRLSLTPQGVLIEDCESKNGTLIESIRIDRAILDPGKTATIGGARIAVRVSGAPSDRPIYPSELFGGAIGVSEIMRVLFAQLDALANSNAPILLVGGPGTGKFTLADAIHKTSSRRAGPFVVFDCKAISDEKMEGDLFGRAHGASETGLLELSHRGTFYIDEPAEMPLPVQHKLLRALEKREFCPVGSGHWKQFDTRIISGTRENLAARAASGEFLKALYDRLAGVEVHVPPLRGQRDQIRALVEHALAKCNPSMSTSDLAPDTMDMLMAHSWPGNVSELLNVLDKLTTPTGVKKAELGALLGHGGMLHIEMGPILGMTLRAARAEVITRFEHAYVKAKLDERKGNVTRTAEAMGVTRQRLHDMMVSLGLKKKK